MDKTKTKKSLVKATAAGFALVLASAFFPVSAIASAAAPIVGDAAKNSTTRIEVNTSTQADKQIKTLNVKKGQTVTIPEGIYYYGGQKVTIGDQSVVSTESAPTDFKSSTVEVFYKATNDKVADTTANSFVANRVGRYSIVYTIVHNDVEYSYELTVNCQASEASFEFDTNSENIIPSVYDIALADNKDIILPLPSVKDSDGEEIQTEYVINKARSNEATSYVNISISNAGKDVNIKSREVQGKTEYYISGEDLSKEELNGQEFKIYYSYYQVGADVTSDVFVASVNKSFTVKSNYFYKTSAKENAGYELETAWSTSVSSLTAVVGVEKELPKVTATTKSTNSPASENVEVYYTIKVFKDGSEVEGLIEDNKFKAKEEGNYKFVYSVKDFYGNTVSESKTTFTIENVKDTLSANVYMYDAGNANAYNEDENKYESAENMLKSQSVKRNIIMYAVGGTDNMVAKEELTLRREIRDNSSVKMFVVNEEAYNGYNLVFAPTATSGDSNVTNINAVRKAIVDDNYEMRKQMAEQNLSITSDSDIATYFKNNKYLLVTTEFNKFGNEDIVADPAGETATIEEMINAGFAYVKPENKNNATFKEQTYSFYYYASDNINTEKSVYYTVKVGEGVTDAEVPTLTFSSDLQVTYLPTDSFEFNVATANDTTDTRIKAVTAYRYLASDRKTAVASADTTSTLKYYVEEVKESVASQWYAQKGLVTSDGWYVDQTKSTYSIDLNNKPESAKYVEILAYAIDDNGNAGFYNKIIAIADAADEDMPEIYKIVNAPTGAILEGPLTVALPTLYFEDSNVNYMHANVSVYKLSDNGTKTRVQSSNMSTEYDTLMDSFKVNAGSFHASTGGKYQVAITVSDSGNHSVTTYFNYQVKSAQVVEVPEISNISADTIELDAGQSYYLVPPTIAMTESADYGYIGLSQDDSNTATNYTTTVISATGDYDIDQYYFKGNEKGLFKLQYKVYLMQYDKNSDALAVEDGSLVYTLSSTKYYVYIDRENNNALAANTSKQGIGTALTGSDLEDLADLVEVYALESKVQTINVGGVEMEVTLDDNAYSDSYTGEVDPVEIIKPTNITFNGSSYQTNNKDSKVTITKTTGSTTTTLAEFNFEEWGNALDANNIANNFDVRANGDVYLKLSGNGKYTIKYSIQAMDKSGLNVGSAKTMEYTFSYGDIIAPEIKLAKDLVKAKYVINDTFTLDLAGITASDLVTDVDYLLDNMVVTLENTDLEEGEKDIKVSKEGEKPAFSHMFTSAGSYVLRIKVTDRAGNKTTEKVNFEVSTEEKEEVDVKEVMGGVLIGLSVAVLAGVVLYFVVSKVKLDKKEKSYKKGNDKK